jgi:hypothetical protein
LAQQQTTEDFHTTEAEYMLPLICRLGVVIFLFGAINEDVAPNYFILLRCVTCATAAWMAVRESHLNRWIATAIALIFNPLIYPPFARGTWQILDVVVGMWFLSTIARLIPASASWTAVLSAGAVSAVFFGVFAARLGSTFGSYAMMAGFVVLVISVWNT